MSVYQQKAEQFISRLKAGPDDPVRGDVIAAFGVAERFATKVAEIRANPRFNDFGKADEIKKALAAGPLESLAQFHRTVDRRIGTLRSELASFAPRAPEKSDIVGELQRRELREFLRGQKDGERQRLALDPAFAEAVAHAPAVLSGITQDVKDAVVGAIIAATHGSKVEATQAGITMLTEAKAALTEAEATVRRESGISETDFAKINSAA